MYRMRAALWGQGPGLVRGGPATVRAGPDVADNAKRASSGAVERVEMEFLHAGGAQQPALLGGDGGGDQRAQLGIFV